MRLVVVQAEARGRDAEGLVVHKIAEWARIENAEGGVEGNRSLGASFSSRRPFL
jgi:hypothetical protein